MAGVGYVLAPLTDKDTTARLLFLAYDVEEPYGSLSAEELAQLLDANIEPPDAGGGSGGGGGGAPALPPVAALVREWDSSRNGQIEFEEFREGLERNPALEAALLGRERAWARGGDGAVEAAEAPSLAAAVCSCPPHWRVAAFHAAWLLKSASQRALACCRARADE
jgi:hypothetical protein